MPAVGTNTPEAKVSGNRVRKKAPCAASGLRTSMPIRAPTRLIAKPKATSTPRAPSTPAGPWWDRQPTASPVSKAGRCG
jgi:hypothetical protein